MNTSTTSNIKQECSAVCSLGKAYHALSEENKRLKAQIETLTTMLSGMAQRIENYKQIERLQGEIIKLYES